MVSREVLEASGLLGGAVGLPIGEPQRRVRIGHACGAGNVTEVLADGLPVDFEGGLPKWAAKAAATRSVVAGSLTVSGKLPAVSKSGSGGEPEAWPSARTIRWVDASMRSRVCWE